MPPSTAKLTDSAGADRLISALRTAVAITSLAFALQHRTDPNSRQTDSDGRAFKRRQAVVYYSVYYTPTAHFTLLNLQGLTDTGSCRGCAVSPCSWPWPRLLSPSLRSICPRRNRRMWRLPWRTRFTPNLWPGSQRCVRASEAQTCPNSWGGGRAPGAAPQRRCTTGMNAFVNFPVPRAHHSVPCA